MSRITDQIYYYHKVTYRVVSEAHIEMAKESFLDYEKIGTMYELRMFVQRVIQENAELKFILQDKSIS